VLVLAALAELLRERDRAGAGAAAAPDPHSPWHLRDGWRLNSSSSRTLKFRAGETERALAVRNAGRGWELEVDGQRLRAHGQLARDGSLRAEFGGRRLSATVIVAGEKRHVFLDGRCWQLAAVDPLHLPGEGSGADGSLSAPMPGKVIALLAEPGTRLDKGAPLLILEAMKMEHTIAAPAAGLLKSFRCAVGDQVSEGAELVEMEIEKA
jgi:3-methylcrotonyl-CoA carboxylase alpha subunit